jgi:hypothetical protein
VLHKERALHPSQQHARSAVHARPEAPKRAEPIKQAVLPAGHRRLMEMGKRAPQASQLQRGRTGQAQLRLVEQGARPEAQLGLADRSRQDEGDCSLARALGSFGFAKALFGSMGSNPAGN